MIFKIIKKLKLKIWEKFHHRDDGLALLIKYAYHFLKGGVSGVRYKYRQQLANQPYEHWHASHMAVSADDRINIGEHIGSMEEKPHISVLMPVYNTPEKWLRKAIESTLNQLYPHLELCIADDNSSQPHIRPILKQYAAKDNRIKLTFRKTNGHISEASNSALELAEGDFVALLDHDDELAEDALYHIACAILENSEANLIYSDEDKIDAKGNLFNPSFKPDWNPDLMRSHNFVCHLAAFRRSVLEEIGGFRKGCEGAQDWDLCLRVAERTPPDAIVHIPRILYHWRMIPGSTAEKISSKSYAIEAGVKVVQDSLDRARHLGYPKGTCIALEEPTGAFRVRYELSDETLVSLVILTRDKLDLLKKCVDSILQKTFYSNYEIIIVDNGSSERETLNFLERIELNHNIRVIRRDIPFNFSQLNNEAVSHAKGEIIGLINNDIEVIEPDWLREMTSHAARPDIGAVGARLLYPDNRVQHAGMITGIVRVAGHTHRGAGRHVVGYGGRIKLIHNVSAVTAACLLVRKEVYLEVGGLEESLRVACNDVDFCLKIRETGYLNLYTPYAELYHHEAKTRGYEDTPEKKARFDSEISYMERKWGTSLHNDPYYNPNLTLRRENFSLADNPRTTKPWEII